MRTRFTTCLLLLSFVVATAYAEEKQTTTKADAGTEVKALSGMSIVGNDEAPKALYLVPWKSSEIGIKTDLDMPDSKGYSPVDRDEFTRKLNYYDIRSTRNTGR